MFFKYFNSNNIFVWYSLVTQKCIHQLLAIFFILTPYFIFIVEMGYTRQSVSIGLALIAISILLKENTIKSNLTYLFLIFTGVLFLQISGYINIFANI